MQEYSNQEINKVERKEEREKVLVPVRRQCSEPKKRVPEESPELSEVEVPEIPRRWHIY